MSAIDEDGIVYFGNENGLLEFDGTHWQLYKTPSFTPITFLKIVEDKIYTFGKNKFGYFQRDKSGYMSYHSLNEKMPDNKEIPYISNVVQFEGDTYFSTDSSLIKWDGEVLNRLNMGANLTMYEFEDKVLLSFAGDNGGLAFLKNDTASLINSDFKFSNDYAWEFLRQNDSNWLIFTSENGIYNFNPDTYETSEFQGEINNFYKKDSTFLYSAERVSDSLFITSSWDDGLQLFNASGDIIKRLDDKSGILWKYNTHSTLDNRGNLWLSTGFGVQYLEFYNPDKKSNFKPEAKVRFIKAGDSSLFVRDSSHILSVSVDKSNSLDFYFSVPGLFTKDLKFSYYLEDFEEDWSDWTTNSRKEYTNLPGGTYTFHLRAKHATQENIDIKPFSFKLKIPKAWYEYPISYVAVGALLALLIFGLVRYRTHRLSITNKKLEQLVNERTSEIESQKEQLRAANEELKTINNELDNFVYRSSHDLVAPLKSLRGLISIAGMTDNVDEIREYFRLMNISINKLEEFIRSIMDFSTNTKKPLEMKEISMDTILDSIVEDLKFYENAEKVELIRAYDSDFIIKTDAKRLNIVLSNLVTNALKYHDFKQDDAPYIKVTAKKKDNNYILEVEDNGSGIPKEHQRKIFDMFYRAHEGIEGSGLGLYIVMDTLNVLKGKIDLKSKTRVGTTFRIVLPLID